MPSPACGPGPDALSPAHQCMTASPQNDPRPAPGGRWNFPTTHWSAVRRAGEPSAGGSEALAALCQRYWFPVYAYVRREGHDATAAQDLTQEFFARLIAGNDVAAAEPHRGRFRSFLLMVLKRFLVNEWERSRAQKRGGGCETLSIDAVDAEERLRFEPVDGMSADRIFERRWALSVIDCVMDRLRAEEGLEGGGGGALFESLRPFLYGDRDSDSQRDIGAKFGLTESAVKARVHRLRRRYRELLREEVKSTVDSPMDVEDELRHLLLALRS